MKSLMMMAVAAFCCVAVAEGPEGGARPAGGRRGGMGPHMGGMGPMADPVVRMVSSPDAAEKLGLSAEQQAKLEEFRKSRGASREAQQKVREATMRQVELMKAAKVDEAAVMKAIDEVFELRKEMAKDQAKRVIAVKSILTPEQIAKAHEEMKKSFAERGNRGMRRNGQHRGGPNRNGGKPESKPEAKPEVK